MMTIVTTMVCEHFTCAQKCFKVSVHLLSFPQAWEAGSVIPHFPDEDMEGQDLNLGFESVSRMVALYSLLSLFLLPQ